MKTFDLARILGGAAIVSLFAIHGALANNTGHTNQITCYASVHSECYGNGENNCSDEVYQGGLDECDSAYGEARPQPGIGGFKATTNNQGGFLMQRGARRN